MYKELNDVTKQLTGPGGPFEIHQIEVLGRPLRAYKGAPADMRQIWLATAPFGDKDYLVYEGERLSYTETHEVVASVARSLVERFGVKAGDRVAIAMRNYPEWPIAYWATVSIGATVVGMNAWWTGPELAYALEDSQPMVVIADRERLHRIAQQSKASAGTHFVAVRTDDTTLDAVPWSELAGPNRRCPRSRSIPTATPASSTRRARPESPRALSSPIAAAPTTS